jgi:hydrogenase maturation protease
VVTSTGLTILVGGVGELFQSDLDVGRRAVESLRKEDPPDGVFVEELTYGAIAVTHRLDELRPDALVLVGARDEPGRPPGTVARRVVHELDVDPEAVQGAVLNAGVGYVDLDLLLTVAAGFDALPKRTVVIEVQPEATGPGTDLSASAAAALDRVLQKVRDEVRLAPLFDIAAMVRDSLADGHVAPSPALDAVTALLSAIETLDTEGRWGQTFGEKNRLEQAIAAGADTTGMTHADWATWWGLIEELTRLEAWSVRDLPGADVNGWSERP